MPRAEWDSGQDATTSTLSMFMVMPLAEMTWGGDDVAEVGH